MFKSLRPETKTEECTSEMGVIGKTNTWCSFRRRGRLDSPIRRAFGAGYGPTAIETNDLRLLGIELLAHQRNSGTQSCVSPLHARAHTHAIARHFPPVTPTGLIVCYNNSHSFLDINFFSLLPLDLHVLAPPTHRLTILHEKRALPKSLPTTGSLTLSTRPPVS